MGGVQRGGEEEEGRREGVAVRGFERGGGQSKKEGLQHTASSQHKQPQE